MPPLRSLPPLFLLPAWSKPQLLQFAATQRSIADTAAKGSSRFPRPKAHFEDRQRKEDGRPTVDADEHGETNGAEKGHGEEIGSGSAPFPPIRKYAGSDNERMPKVYRKIRLRYMHAMRNKDIAPIRSSPADKGDGYAEAGGHVGKDPRTQPGWAGIDPKTLMTDEELEVVAERARSQQNSSLFEELFPNEARLQRDRATRATQKGNDTSQSQLDIDPVTALTATAPTETPNALPSSSHTPSVQHMRWKQDKVSLLYVGGVSTDMTAADFHRLIPRGSHIPAWRAPGDFLSVIPGRISGRDPANLCARRWYVLVFGNPASAQAYRDNIVRMHSIARAHTPTSLLSTPLPPRGFVVDGVHVHRALADYALFPPSVAKPDLQVLLARDNWTFRSLLERRGYAVLRAQSRQPKAGRSVRLWVAGYSPSEAQVEAMLARNGRDRGLQWTPFDGSGRGDVVRLYTSDEDEAGRGPDRNTPGLFRWLLTFADEAEARRFVRTWHLRPFRLPPEQRDAGEPAPKVHAEFVW